MTLDSFRRNFTEVGFTSDVQVHDGTVIVTATPGPHTAYRINLQVSVGGEWETVGSFNNAYRHYYGFEGKYPDSPASNPSNRIIQRLPVGAWVHAQVAMLVNAQDGNPEDPSLSLYVGVIA